MRQQCDECITKTKQKWKTVQNKVFKLNSNCEAPLGQKLSFLSGVSDGEAYGEKACRYQNWKPP